MTKPNGPIIGGVHLDDGLHTKYKWTEEVGISEPAPRPAGAIKDTFGGPYRIIPNPEVSPTAEMLLTGYLLNLGGQNEGYARLRRVLELAKLSSVQPTLLQVGVVARQIVAEAPEIPEFKSHSKLLYYAMAAKAVPGVWQRMYQGNDTVTGRSLYGMCVNDASLSELGGTGASYTGNPITVASSVSTAPLQLEMNISGITTSFYIRVMGPGGYNKRIVVTPVNGVAKVTKDMGLYLMPGGSNYIKYENSSGALITGGTYKTSLYNTVAAQIGAGNDTTVEPLILYNTRQQRAYAATSAFTTNSGLSLYGPDVPRFGNSGTYDANDAGLVVEPDRTNLCLQSESIATGPWTTGGSGVAVVSDAVTAPEGNTTADQMTTTAATYGDRRQTITVANTSVYVASVYVRAGSAGAASRLIVADGGGSILASTEFTPSANWARYSVIFTTISTSINIRLANAASGAASDNYWWGVQVELATGQTAANATSYIPTTSTTQRRYGDIVGVRRLENLLAWSNRFDKTTTTSGGRGLWYVNGTPTISTTLQTGPSGVVDATSIAFGLSGQYIEQNLINAEIFAGKTVVISLWVKNSSATPSSNFTLRLTDGGGGYTEHQIVNLDDQWRRVEVQRAIPATSSNLYFNARVTGSITVYIAHAHAFVASEGTYNLASGDVTAISAPYIETQGTPYQAQGTWTWPDWLTQNGYLEADICLSETANPNNVFRYMLGGYTLAYSPNIEPATLYRSSATGSASNALSYVKTHTTGTPYKTYTPTSSVFDGAYHKWRLEWVNYTIAGTRTFELRLYLDGALVDTNTIAGTSWVRPPFLAIVDGATQPAFQTMKNIKIGSPALPAGAVPEPY